MKPETMGKYIDLAHRTGLCADRAERQLQVIKKQGDGQGMKVVRKETWMLLRRGFLLWLRVRLGI